jgi:hypothetical protein
MSVKEEEARQSISPRTASYNWLKRYKEGG